MNPLLTRMRVTRTAMTGVVVALALTAVQCKSNPAAPARVVTSNVNVGLNTSTVAAVTGQTFSIPGGGSALGKPALANKDIDITFTTSGSATTTTINVSGGGQIVATTTFGSCILTVTSVSGNAAISGGVLVGDIININPCTLTLGTSGVVADGQTHTVATTLQWGPSWPSVSKPLVITVQPDGTITVPAAGGGTVTVGVAPTQPGTGA